MPTIYMDHSATTPVSEHALQEMLPWFRQQYGNPSAVYSLGQDAHTVLEKCRNRVAKCLHVLPTEIYFTGGGTEGDNWAIRGACRARKAKGRHIITSAIEHNAVLRTVEQLEEDGYEVTRLQPDSFGVIAPEQLEAAIRPDTILVSIMLANNVVGTIQDIAALAAIARSHRVLFHTDAVQAVGHIPVDARKLGVDLLSLSAHKFGGPKGVGVLYCRLPNRPDSILTGGGQEKGARSGTENIPAIVGMTAALEESLTNLEEDTARLLAMRARVIAALTQIPGVTLTGHPEKRLPGFCSFLVDGLPHSVLLMNKMNEYGICVSSGSACSASSKEASHVLLAMGYPKELASNSLRITLGADNTEEEVDYLIAKAPEIIEAVRRDTRGKAPRLEGRVTPIASK